MRLRGPPHERARPRNERPALGHHLNRPDAICPGPPHGSCPTWSEPTGRARTSRSCLPTVRRTRAAACRASAHCPASLARRLVVVVGQGARTVLLVHVTPSWWARIVPSGVDHQAWPACGGVLVGHRSPIRRRAASGSWSRPQRAHDATSCPNELVLGHGPGRGAQARNDGNDRGDAGEQLVIQLFGRRINVAPRGAVGLGAAHSVIPRPRRPAACRESTSRFVCRTTGVWS